MSECDMILILPPEKIIKVMELHLNEEEFKKPVSITDLKVIGENYSFTLVYKDTKVSEVKDIITINGNSIKPKVVKSKHIIEKEA